MHAHLRNGVLVATLILVVISDWACAQQDDWQSVTTQRDRYVTRFEAQPKLTYTREITYEPMPFIRKGWNPFQPPTIEYRSVPTVKWVSRWQERVLPITERQTRTETTLVRVQSAPSPSRLASRPAPWNPAQRQAGVMRPELHYGGVAQMDEDVPQVGFRLQRVVR